MAIKHSLPKKSIEGIHFIPAGMGESGWIIYLNEGYSFDPGSIDTTRFIPSDSLGEALNLTAFKVPAAKKTTAAD